MVCVDNTMFLAELARLYTAAVDGPRGSVWVTFKRRTWSASARESLSR
jgi:hypothetical protein